MRNAPEILTVEQYKNLSKKKAKYGNKKCVYDGIKFDSTGEKNRYIDLKFQQSRGFITDLKVQVEYGLFYCKYRCDFQYYRDGKLVVEDFKGGSPRTRLYKYKRKLMREIHKIILLET